MTAAFCPTCSRAQGHRDFCCPAAASHEVEILTAERAALADEVRCLRDEIEILEALRSEVIQLAEAEGVWFP